MERAVRGSERGDGQAPQRAGKRERTAEAHCGGHGLGHRDAEGTQRGKMVSPERKRQAVLHLQECCCASERRACRAGETQGRLNRRSNIFD